MLRLDGRTQKDPGISFTLYRTPIGEALSAALTVLDFVFAVLTRAGGRIRIVLRRGKENQIDARNLP
jgi:hypothetical protein